MFPSSAGEPGPAGREEPGPIITPPPCAGEVTPMLIERCFPGAKRSVKFFWTVLPQRSLSAACCLLACNKAQSVALRHDWLKTGHAKKNMHGPGGCIKRFFQPRQSPKSLKTISSPRHYVRLSGQQLFLLVVRRQLGQLIDFRCIPKTNSGISQKKGSIRTIFPDPEGRDVVRFLFLASEDLILGSYSSN